MAKQLIFKNLTWLLVSLGFIIIDQVTKLLALIQLADGHTVRLTAFLRFELVFNQGAAFSFLHGAGGWQRYFFTILALIITAGLVIYLLQLRSRLQCFAISLIIAGALGNVVDRLHYGFVIDFIDAHIGQYHWPVFNIADSLITIGVIILIIKYFNKQFSAQSKEK